MKAENHVLEVRKRKLTPKILKKFIGDQLFTMNDHAFFQNFGSRCVPL